LKLGPDELHSGATSGNAIVRFSLMYPEVYLPEAVYEQKFI